MLRATHGRKTHTAAFRLIGKPSGIRFQWNAAKCSLIIEPTDINNPDGFPVIGKRYAQRKSMFIGGYLDDVGCHFRWQIFRFGKRVKA